MNGSPLAVLRDHVTGAIARGEATAIVEQRAPCCPLCGAGMYDNRASKRNPKAPDFKCMRYKAGCQGVVWPVRAAAAAVPEADRVTEPGMYRDANGDLYKVQASRDDESKLYAKALTRIGGQRLTETDETVRFEFTYAPGAVYRLRASDRLSLDDAKAFGIRYGVCCVCGRTLKDASSVAAGIGPICAGNV